AVDRTDFAAVRVVVELRREDVFRRHDALERGDHDFARRGGYDVERERDAVDAALEEVDEGAQSTLETHALAGFGEVFATHAAVFGIVTDQVGELTALLHQVAAGEAGDLLFEAANAEQLAQLEARVVEAQRLIEVGREQEMFRDFRVHKLLH